MNKSKYDDPIVSNVLSAIGTSILQYVAEGGSIAVVCQKLKDIIGFDINMPVFVVGKYHTPMQVALYIANRSDINTLLAMGAKMPDNALKLLYNGPDYNEKDNTVQYDFPVNGSIYEPVVQRTIRVDEIILDVRDVGISSYAIDNYESPQWFDKSKRLTKYIDETKRNITQLIESAEAKGLSIGEMMKTLCEQGFNINAHFIQNMYLSQDKCYFSKLNYKFSAMEVALYNANASDVKVLLELGASVPQDYNRMILEGYQLTQAEMISIPSDIRVPLWNSQSGPYYAYSRTGYEKRTNDNTTTLAVLYHAGYKANPHDIKEDWWQCMQTFMKMFSEKTNKKHPYVTYGLVCL